jgi:hypothetical protein
MYTGKMQKKSSLALTENPPKAIFVNSSVIQLVESLSIYRQQKERFIGKDLDDDVIYSQLTQDIEQRIKHIDSKALDDEENWWALIIEQMYDGLL